MTHAITIGGLLLGAVLGFGLTAGGLFNVAAQSMSDVPDENPAAGCIIALVGVALIIGCVVGLVR